MAAHTESLTFKQPPSASGPEPVGILTILEETGLLSPGKDLTDRRLQNSWRADTPESLQLIQSGASKLTRWWVQAIAGMGGATAAVAVVTGYIRSFTDQAGTPITIALVAGGALIASSVILSIAIFVRGDLMSRGTAAAAQLEARGRVLAAFLRSETVLATSGCDGTDASDGLERLADQLKSLKIKDADLVLLDDGLNIRIHGAP